MAAKPKIVIVEDDTNIRELYKRELKLKGFEVQTAEDGVVGLEVIEKFQPDVVLLDIWLPHMNGHEMLEQMRKTTWGQKTKVIVWTNFERPQAPKILEELDISRYVVKSDYTPKQTVELVNEVLAEK